MPNNRFFHAIFVSNDEANSPQISLDHWTLRAYPRILWKGASGLGILNNQTVLGRALNLPGELL